MPKDKVRTRHQSKECGAPASLPDVATLHVNQDIIADIRYHQIPAETRRHQPDTKQAILNLAEKLETKFLQVNPNVPLLPQQAVVQKINRLIQAYNDYKRKQMTSRKAKKFVDSLLRLFDIIYCRCNILPCTEVTSYLCSGPQSCSGYHAVCSCALDRRIPHLEVAFIKDQRDKIGTIGGKEMMEGIDRKEASKMQKSLAIEEVRLMQETQILRKNERKLMKNEAGFSKS